MSALTIIWKKIENKLIDAGVIWQVSAVKNPL